MQPQGSAPRSNRDWLDLNLPVPERPLPTLPVIPVETVFALNDEWIAEMVYDEAYFAESLARKNPERFVL
jgi:hypothetical protein